MKMKMSLQIEQASIVEIVQIKRRKIMVTHQIGLDPPTVHWLEVGDKLVTTLNIEGEEMKWVPKVKGGVISTRDFTGVLQ